MSRQKGKLGFTWHNFIKSGYISFGHAFDIYFGESGQWGFEFTYEHEYRALHLMLVHWYVGVQVWNPQKYD